MTALPHDRIITMLPGGPDLIVIPEMGDRYDVVITNYGPEAVRILYSKPKILSRAVNVPAGTQLSQTDVFLLSLSAPEKLTVVGISLKKA